jgi:DNA/RNA-binding domain of Phe-tRNA-synthetase-like protein
MMSLQGTEAWAHAHEGAVVGMLVVRGAATGGEDALAPIRARIEAELRTRFHGTDDMKADPTLQAYRSYYKRFDKTYHVFQQLESVALKGKPIPTVIPLVEVFFMAELKNFILTAGHDAAALAPPFTVGSASGEERYVTMRGEERLLKASDMMISDAQGVISSIILGPDQRSKITTETRDALFFAYGPAGVPDERVRAHLEDIRGYVLAFSPRAETEGPVTVQAR